MSDRRPLSSLTSGDFDHPPATLGVSDNVTSRLHRFRRTLERHREESRTQAESSRHERWGNAPSLRRRRLLRPTGVHSPTYEGRSLSRSDESLDEDDRPRNAKRRKLDGPSHAIYDRSHKYGHFGQVQPGRLKMEICSCDGGVHEERGPIYYGSTNMMRHDQSVYSSKAPHCNIIMRHHDNTAFCLETLHILAPENGFTSPVKQGSVCIGMGLEDLMPVAADSLIYSMDEARQTLEDEDHGEARLSLLESLRDPEISSAMRQRDVGAWSPGGPPPPYPVPEPLPPANSTSNRDARIWPHEFSWPPLEPNTRTPSSTRHHPQPSLDVESVLESGMKVTLAYDEEVGFPEDLTSANILADRHRREQQSREDDADSDEELARPWDHRYRNSFNRLQRGVRPRMDLIRQSNTPTGMEKKPFVKDVTQVRFSIQQGKSKVAIKFDPPVSGTCILLQMQSMPGSRNVDVQTVLTCGYAGPRFFPSVQMK